MFLRDFLEVLSDSVLVFLKAFAMLTKVCFLLWNTFTCSRILLLPRNTKLNYTQCFAAQCEIFRESISESSVIKF